MKPIIYSILLLLLVNTKTSYSQNNFGVFAKEEFNLNPKNDAEDLNYFTYLIDTKKQMLDFLDIKKGDKVVEVGAGDCINIGIMAMFYDSVHFTAQDIDIKYLNAKNLNSKIKYYSKLRSTPQTNTFNLVIGTKTASNLTDNTFDELFIINSFHDFDNKDEMVDDIYKKLKPNGRFLLLEGYSFPNDTQVCPDYGPHVLNTLDVEVARLEKHGLYLTKMRAPNFKAAHYGNGLIFEKDKNKSIAFYKLKNSIDELVSHTFRFKQNTIASDSIAMKQIIDSIKPNINTITNVYNEFEVWIKELGLKHLMKLEYKAAENIFKANITFFPTSYQAYYWLGLAYEKQKQYNLALANYNISLDLNPKNMVCLNKIKSVKKLH